MKTIKEGTPPSPKPWWVGATIRCQKCGFIGTLEAGDPVAITASDMHVRPGDPRAWIMCPTPECREKLDIPVQRHAIG